MIREALLFPLSHSPWLACAREHGEGYQVELIRHEKNGRLVIRARNECQNAATAVDLLDFQEWLKCGPLAAQAADSFRLPIRAEL